MQVFKGLSTQSPNPFTLLSINLPNHYAPLMYETANILQNSCLTHLERLCFFCLSFSRILQYQEAYKAKIMKTIIRKKIANFSNNKSFYLTVGAQQSHKHASCQQDIQFKYISTVRNMQQVSWWCHIALTNFEFLLHIMDPTSFDAMASTGLYGITFECIKSSAMLY